MGIPPIRGQGGGNGGGEYPLPGVQKNAPPSMKKFIYYCSPPHPPTTSNKEKTDKICCFLIKHLNNFARGGEYPTPSGVQRSALP